MSIKAMTWAFGLPLEPRAKIALLAIADNARDDGVAWPSKDTIADKSSQSRATVGRRLKSLEALGVLACFARYRPDGTQTTDEIRLNLAVTPDDVMRKMHDAGDGEASDSDEESSSRAEDDTSSEGAGGGYQPDTLGSQSCNPTLAVVTGGGLQSCNPQDEPSFEPSKKPPNPLAGGSEPKSDQQEGKPEPEHFEAFFTACQHWRTMHRARALTAFGFLNADEQARARAASPLHADECTKAKRRSKDAHKLLGEKFWERYPNAILPGNPPDPVWIEEGPDIDALRTLALITGNPPPTLIHDEVKGSGLLRLVPIGDDLRGLSAFAEGELLDWFVAEPDTREFKAWRHRLHEWTLRWHEPRIVKRRGKRIVEGLGEVNISAKGIPVPCRWPPKKDGTIYPNTNEGNTA